MRDITAKELLVIQIEIGRPTIDWEFGRELLKLFSDFDTRLKPQILNVWNDKVADFSDVDDAQPHWAGIGQVRSQGALSEFHVGLGWRRRLTTQYQAEISHEHRNAKGLVLPATLSVYAKPHKAIDWRGFAERLYGITEAPYGFTHLHRDTHLRSDLSNAREPTWITGQRSQETVPQLGWSTFLGKPYLHAIPEGRLRADQMNRIGDGVALTITPNIMDVAEAYRDFDDQRAIMKAAFPDGFFEIQECS